LPRDAWIVGFVGRLSAEKGPDVLLDAMASLRDLPIIAAFVGEGREEAALRAKSSELGSGTWFAGFPSSTRRLTFQAFDAFALSRHRGNADRVVRGDECWRADRGDVGGWCADVVTPHEAVMIPPDAPRCSPPAFAPYSWTRTGNCSRASRRRQARDEFAPGPWLRRYEDIYAEALAFRSEHD